MEQDVIIYGIRHLSAAGAFHLHQLLERIKPAMVLVEGPSDMTEQMVHIVSEDTKPPIAIMAYTKETPIKTILYPFAVYSPEYEAICWSYEHQVPCRFIDLPSGTFLAIRDMDLEQKGEENINSYVYEKLDELSGEESHEVFWERNLEHTRKEEDYFYGAREFGRQLRSLTETKSSSYAENLVREAYMRRQIEIAKKQVKGVIVVVTGAYHAEGLLGSSPIMTEEEEKSLPFLESAITLMPYSYYRLSDRSGYGAGNKAPAYYELLYEGLQKNDISYAAYSYLSKIAAYQRNYGHMVSSAEVIEAVQLADSLAKLQNKNIPSLRDLTDAAVTCMGHGYFSEIALAVADTQIGTKIGSLPEGISRTSIQEDFYHFLKDLKLEKYKSVIAQDLQLDLREKLTVKSEKSAFLDLNRSFFLHQLRVLNIHFAENRFVSQDRATWAEHWILRWTPEAEIEIVEAALKGETIEYAASYVLKERVENSTSISEIAAVIKDTSLCGMESSMIYATAVLQRLTTEAAAILDIAKTAKEISFVVRYGTIRQLNPEPLKPILEQLFLRGCLLLVGSCVCDNNAAVQVIEAMEQLNEVSIAHDFLNNEQWIQTLHMTAQRDDLNTKASGYAMAILLERGEIEGEELGIEVERRLSKGVPADLGASWFEGLSLKNRYSLIARMSLWKKLSEYLDCLEEDEFKRALVFLRRAFADFNAKEKNDIAENLGELWNLNPQNVSEILNTEITKEEKDVLKELEEFNFDDI